MRDFIGAKVALINRNKVLVILRDSKPDIVFPGMWDFPGGYREEGETPSQAAIRETKEELSLDITADEVVWEKVYPSVVDASKDALFMVVHVTDEQLKAVAFGDEGQEWKMMPFGDFIYHKNAVPGMQTRLRDYLAQR